MSDHTKEPWYATTGINSRGYPSWRIRSGNGKSNRGICSMDHLIIGRKARDARTAANARRIVACVNFLAGIETENLVNGEWKAALMATKPYVRPSFHIEDVSELEQEGEKSVPS